jgi:photosystem II stability/assembly factor-like uncharacterized protein
MNKRAFVVLLAALFAIPSFAGRESSFLTGGPEGGPILRLVFSPADPNFVLACGYFGSIYYSEDAGRTWTRTATPGALGSTFNAAFDPAIPSVVYAAGYGVGRSEDSGRTWTNASIGLPGFRVNCLVVDSAHPGTVLAGSSTGLFRTVDSAASWTPFGSGLPAGKSITELSVDPANPGTILAAADGNVFRSTDGGATWGGVAGLAAASEVFEVSFDPTTPGRAFAGSARIYRSSDHGASWNAVNDASFVGNVNQFAYQPGAILVAENNALVKSTNGGISWTAFHNGIPPRETYFNGVAVAPGNSIVLAGVEANGVLRSTDGGSTWTVAKTGIFGNVSPQSIAIDPSNPRRAVAGFVFSGGQRTTDGGRTWTWIPDFGIDTVFSTLAVPGAAGRFVAGTAGAYYSSDGGATWHASSPQIDDNVFSLAAASSASHPLFAGTGSSGVWKSTDGGVSWHPASAGLPTTQAVNALAAGPAPASIVYAGLNDGSIWKSTDSGVSWHPAGASPDSSPIRSLAGDPNHGNFLFAGTSQGLSRSTDGGASWASLDSATVSDGDAVSGIAMPAGLPGTVLATVYGGGVFVSRDDGATWHVLDPHFPRVIYSYLAAAIASDATGEWIYEGSEAAGIFLMSPASVDPVVAPPARKVKGTSR